MLKMWIYCGNHFYIWKNMSLGESNPLQKHAQAIAKASEYIDGEIAHLLLSIIPERFKREFMKSHGDEAAGDPNLRKQLRRLMKLQEKILLEAESSEDSQAHKNAMNAGRDMFNLFIKFEATIDSQERLLAIETAVKDSISMLEDVKIRDIFMENLRNSLSEANKKLRNPG